MSLYARLGFDFDTTKFNGADTLSAGAANTLTLVANSTGTLNSWQAQDVSNGAIVRSDYFQNPLASNNATILGLAHGFVSFGTTDDVTNSSNTLITVVNQFQRHTDNISGVAVVSNTMFPSLSTAQGAGQMNMLNLSKSDGVSNTTAILGSFTSLFIGSDLQANIANLTIYYNQYANSITSGIDPETMEPYSSSNLSPTQIATISSYISNTSNMMTTRINHDVNFFRNSMQMSKDVAFVQQFTNMGGTMSYLVNNLVGTDSLKTKLNS